MSQQPTLIAKTRARTTVLLITAAALALSACTGPAGAEPSASPAPVASATAIESPTPSPTSSAEATYKPATEDGPAENVPVPELPKAATIKTADGLTAFGQHWLAAVSYAYESGDLRPLHGISGDGCTVCREVSKTVNEWMTDGHWIAGGKVELVTSQTAFQATEQDRYQVVLHFSQDELRFYLPDGSLNNSVDQHDSLLMMEATFSEGSWTADVVELMDS